MSNTSEPPPTVLAHVMVAVPYVVGLFMQAIEKCLFLLVDLYDNFMYTPIQKLTSPVVARIPRNIVRNDKVYTVFSANIVSWSRTLLVVPIAYCLKYQFHWTAFWLVILHDFLDHIDGIVARVQTSLYGRVDDPLLGGFMDAFCDKIVNVSCLWTILIVTDFSKMSGFQCFVYLTSCTVIIIYEFTLGVVRVQDYFRAYYDREYNRESKASSSLSISAGMEGKLKEKLESMGIACLCLAQAGYTAMDTKVGIVGVICLLLSVRLAHASLMRKINARSETLEKKPLDEPAVPTPCEQMTKQNMDHVNRKGDVAMHK